MKVTEIQITGQAGSAHLSRCEGQVHIAAGRWPKDYKVHKQTIPAVCDDAALNKTARWLMRNVDGYVGTNGDLADYRRVIEQFCD